MMKNNQDHQRTVYITKRAKESCCGKYEFKNKKYKQVLLDVCLIRAITVVKCIFFIIFHSYQLMLSH